MAGTMLDESDLLKKRQSVLDVGQRNQLEGVQAEIRRNADALTSLRRENKELRSVLQQTLRGQRNIDIDDHYRKEEELLHNKMCVLKRSLNAVKGKNMDLVKEIEKINEDNFFVQKEGNAALDESSAVAQKIRTLENRLDKCLIKHNEVNAIRRTYETLLERLQLEQGGFDTQLAATEKALQNSQKELAELTEVGQQAAKERDQAKSDVLRLKSQLVEERRVQRKDMDQRRGFVQEKRDTLEKKHNLLLVKMAQQEERHARVLQGYGTLGLKKRGASNRSTASLVTLRPEEVDYLQRQKEAYQRLRDATMAGTVAEVIQKLMERTESNAQLQQTVAELEAAVARLRQERAQLQEQWTALNQRAGGAMVSARVTRVARDHHLHHIGKSTTAAGVPETGGQDSDDDDDKRGLGVVDVNADFRLLGDRQRENALVVAEFEGHLQERQLALQEAQHQQETLVQLLQHVEVGVRHLAEKLTLGDEGDNGNVTAESSRAATPALELGEGRPLNESQSSVDGELTAASLELLRRCDARLRRLLAELTPAELEHMATLLATSRVAVAATNLRLPAIALAQQSQQDAVEGVEEIPEGSLVLGGKGGRAHGKVMAGAGSGSGVSSGAYGGAMVDDFPDNEIHDRVELKMMSLATVEREEKKARKQQQQRRKEESA